MGCWPRKGLLRVSTAATLAILFCAAGALGATQWLGLPYSVTMASHISGVGQACEGTKALTLEHDGPCTIHVSVNTGGDEVLTLGGSGGPTLETFYKLTGMADQDAGWLTSTNFLARTYNTPAGAGTENLTLSVRGLAPADKAPTAGNYQATIILTVTF
jgi:type 1 fimbria pilin